MFFIYVVVVAEDRERDKLLVCIWVGTASTKALQGNEWILPTFESYLRGHIHLFATTGHLMWLLVFSTSKWAPNPYFVQKIKIKSILCALHARMPTINHLFYLQLWHYKYSEVQWKPWEGENIWEDVDWMLVLRRMVWTKGCNMKSRVKGYQTLQPKWFEREILKWLKRQFLLSKMLFKGLTTKGT